MRLAAVGVVAGVAALPLLLGGCGDGGRNTAGSGRSSVGGVAGRTGGAGAPGTGPTAAAGTWPSTGPTTAPTTNAGVPVGWAVIQPSASASTSVAPAAEQAASAVAADPSARAYPSSSTDAVYSIAGVGVSGTVEYVDAYSVAFVCGGGIPDDCDRFIGTPEYRIPLAAGARFVLLGTGMRPNRPVDFAAFRQYAAGPDGRFDGNYDLFEITLSSTRQATSLTAVYTP